LLRGVLFSLSAQHDFVDDVGENIFGCRENDNLPLKCFLSTDQDHRLRMKMMTRLPLKNSFHHSTEGSIRFIRVT
jgi:hypothetical protein